MTLSTNIRVIQKTDPYELHAWINKNLLKKADAVFYGGGDSDAGSRNNNPMQGLSAWLLMHWDEKGLPTSREQWPEDYEGTEHGLDEPKGAFLNIDFDTAYGYNEDGMGCTELHASFIVRLATEYFAPRRLDFYWQNEYTGKWAHGLDREKMQEFFGGGDEAMNWFNNIVVPTISAEAAASGGSVEWL